MRTMKSTTPDKLRTAVAACLFVLVGNCSAASLSLTTTSLPTTTDSSNNNRFILDTANLDLNNDGCISGKEELESFKQHVADALAGIPNSDLRAYSIVHRTDVNRDGKICWCDFISIYLHEKDPRRKHSVPFLVLPDSVMFTQLDENHDGQLASHEKDKLEKEFESCLPHGQAESIVKAIAGSLTKDDSVSLEEFQTFFNTPKDKSIKSNPATLMKGNNP